MKKAIIRQVRIFLVLGAIFLLIREAYVVMPTWNCEISLITELVCVMSSLINVIRRNELDCL